MPIARRRLGARRDARKIPTFGWKGYKLADLTFAELDDLRQSVIADPKNHTPRDAKGHPRSGIWLYTPSARKKLEALAWAVTYKLQGQGGATRRSRDAAPRKRRPVRMSDLYGLARRAGLTPRDFPPRTLAQGTRVEMEHTRSRAVAQQIAMDHLTEDLSYYRKLAKMEGGR